MSDLLFLTAKEMHELTGFVLKSRQIEQLRKMAIPFRINGCGKPIVTRLAIEGEIKKQLIPNVVAWQSDMQKQERKVV